MEERADYRSGLIVLFFKTGKQANLLSFYGKTSNKNKGQRPYGRLSGYPVSYESRSARITENLFLYT